MNDDRLLLDVRAWLQDEHIEPPDSEAAAEWVIARLPRQRRLGRRRWSWRHEASARGTITHRTGPYEPAPIEATNGRTHTQTGRSLTMLSPAKAAAAAALAFLVGGAFLVGQSLDPRGSGLPGAENGYDRPTPVLFTASYAWSHQPQTASREILENGVVREDGDAWLFRSFEASDPRFAGTNTLTVTNDTLLNVTVTTGISRIENDDGAWQEVPTSWITFTERPDTPDDGQNSPGETVQRVFYGEGDYEGLVAVAVETWRPDGDAARTDIHLDGVILDVEDLPPAPEPWSP